MAFSISISAPNSHLNLGASLNAAMQGTVASLQKSGCLGNSGLAQQAQGDRFTFSLDSAASATASALASAQSGRAMGPQITQELQANLASAGASVPQETQALSYSQAVTLNASQPLQAAQANASNVLDQAHAPPASTINLLR